MVLVVPILKLLCTLGSCFANILFYPLKHAGLPWSGKNVWKMKFFPGLGKVREFCGWPGKFRMDLESQGIRKYIAMAVCRQ